MLKKIVLTIGVVVVVFVVVVATRPDAFRVERSAQIAAPPAEIFALVNDFHSWNRWSPWGKLDPGMKTTYSGADSGAGAVYEWSGNDKVGVGRMTITESRPTESLTIKLEFIKPWTATNTSTFKLDPAGPGTQVTWAMEGRNNFAAKAFGLFMNMDKMIGKDFENGLAQMRTAAESDTSKRAEAR